MMRGLQVLVLLAAMALGTACATMAGSMVGRGIGEATGGHDGQMTKQGLLDIYELFGWIAIGAAVVVLLLSPIVKRWMHLDTLRDRDDGLAGVGEAEPLAAGVHPEPKGA